MHNKKQGMNDKTNKKGFMFHEFKNIIYISLIFILIFVPSTCSGECYNLTTNENGYLYVNDDTNLCQGIYSNARIIINSSNIVLDCNNATLNGNDSGYGINLNNKNNVTIKNCNVMNYGTGIYLNSSSNNIIANNTINSNYWDGIDLDNSNFNKIKDNEISNNNGSIDMYASSSNIITKNHIHSNEGGLGWLELYLDEDESYFGRCTIYLDKNSLNNNITGNNISHNTGGICSFVYGNDIANIKTIIADNVFYLNNDFTIAMYGPWVCDIHTDNYTFNNISILNNTIYSGNGGAGIFLQCASSSIIADNSISNDLGVIMSNSFKNTIINNNISNNYNGIILSYSSNNTLINNKVNSNDDIGIYLLSSNNTIQGNEISNNSVGIQSQNSNSTINSNIVCGNTNLDFNSSDWLTSSGDNNTCDNPDGWNDTNTAGCRYSCSAQPTECVCNSCDDCTNKLNNNSCTYIILNENITNHPGTTCINSPINFKNKTFDCQGHTIDGVGKSWSSGITLSGLEYNSEIKNCIITDWDMGILSFISPQTQGSMVPLEFGNVTINSTGNASVIISFYCDGYYCMPNNTILNNSLLVSFGNLTNNDGEIIGYENIVKDTEIIQINETHAKVIVDAYITIPANVSVNKTYTGSFSVIFRVSDSYGMIVSSANTTRVYVSDAPSQSNISVNISGLSGSDHIPSDYFLPSNLLITNNIIKSNNDGIFGHGMHNFTVFNNTILKNNNSGIYLYSDSNFNKILNNKILNNIQAGIKLTNEGNANNNNTIQGNEISNNNIGIYSQNSNSTINSNFVCGNINLDFNSSDWLSSSGDNNACDNADGWNDTGKIGCSLTCQQYLCDLNQDGIYIQDYNDLMTAYKCFLGINRNCDNYYQNWSSMRQEYDCFVNQ